MLQQSFYINFREIVVNVFENLVQFYALFAGKLSRNQFEQMFLLFLFFFLFQNYYMCDILHAKFNVIRHEHNELNSIWLWIACSDELCKADSSVYI